MQLQIVLSYIEEKKKSELSVKKHVILYKLYFFLIAFIFPIILYFCFCSSSLQFSQKQT